jgi:hypothetical protein
MSLAYAHASSLAFAVGYLLFVRVLWAVYVYPLYLSPYLGLPQARVRMRFRRPVDALGPGKMHGLTSEIAAQIMARYYTGATPKRQQGPRVPQ